MTTLQRGEKRKLAELNLTSPVTVTLDAGLSGADVSVFGLNADRKLEDDRYFVFFNQTRSPNGEIVSDVLENAGRATFTLDLNKLPANVTRLMFVATHDERPFSQATQGSWQAGGATYTFSGRDFQAEQAVMVAEVYLHAGEWRVAAVGQGFAGGLQSLLEYFGGEASQETPAVPAAQPTPAAPAPSSSVNLKKEARVKLDKDIEQHAPQLVSLVKQAEVSLRKKGLDEHTAKMALVLDISGSMSGLYRSGTVQRVVERALALGSRFDDDGKIDVFLFGVNAHHAGEVGVRDVTGYVDRLMREYRLEGGTQYGKAMQMLRNHYFGSSVRRQAPVAQPLPVYVMFVTDGETQGRDHAVQQMKDGSYEPMFYKFLGVGYERFEFLQRLDDLFGRLIDNADFVAVNDIDRIGDAELYERLIQEYPEFLRNAQKQSMIPTT